MGKIIRRTLTALLIVMSLLTAAVVHAEVQTYTGVGEYYMSDFETPNVAQQRAKQRAEQNACELAGVYVKSFSRTKNFELVEDEIITMTSGILKIIDVQFKRENFDNNTTLIRATIKAQIDSDDVLKWLDKSDDEKSTLERQYAEIRKAYAEQEKQIAELKKQLANVKTPQDEEHITQKFAEEDKIFLSHQKIEEAWKLFSDVAYEYEDYNKITKVCNEVIKLCNEAIDLNPNNTEAYFRRGTAYDKLDNYQRAIEDFDKTIQLDPEYENTYYYFAGYAKERKNYHKEIAYLNKLIEIDTQYGPIYGYGERAEAYENLNDFKRALQDYNKVIELDPDAGSYLNRANFYRRTKNYQQALNDCNKALEISSRSEEKAYSYYILGMTYYDSKNYNEAIDNYNKCLEFADSIPFFKRSLYERGRCYQALGEHEKALADFNEIIIEAPVGDFYYSRALSYKALGETAKAQADFAKAKELGYNG